LKRRSTTLCAALLCLAASACQRPPADAVAVWDGGFVSQAELDARIATLPVKERRPQDVDVERWRAGLIRELAVEEIVLAEVEGQPRPPELEAGLQEQRRQVAVAAYLEEHLPALEPPTEEELRAAHEEWLPAYRQSERRLVRHIFFTAPDDARAGPAQERMAALRERVLAGEDFSLLATQHSDSETRHRDGLLGWYARGQLDPRLEEEVFSLPLQEPSRPIRTGSGIHMLWIEAVAGGQEHSFEEVRGLVARRLSSRRREEAARALVRSEPPAGSFVPDRQALATLLREGDPRSLVLRVGEFVLRLGDLRARLAELGSPTAPMDVIRALATRELLYLQCLEEGCADRPRVAQRLARLERDAVVQHELHERLLMRVLEDRPKLEEYYARNRKRYLEPVRWRLTRGTFPLGTDPAGLMSRLEAARTTLDGGELTLEDLTTELGGSIESLGWKSLALLRSESPTLLKLLPELDPGDHTPPYGWGEALEVVRCDERLDPAPVALERVERAVAEDLVKNEGPALYEALIDDLLGARGFRLVGRSGPGTDRP